MNLASRAAGCAGALLLVAMLFDWYALPADGLAGADLDEAQEAQRELGINLRESAGVERGFSAWRLFAVVDLVLLTAGLVAIAWAVADWARDDELRGRLRMAAVALAGLAVVLILYRIADPPYSLDYRFGVFLGLGAATTAFAAGLLSFAGPVAATAPLPASPPPARKSRARPTPVAERRKTSHRGTESATRRDGRVEAKPAATPKRSARWKPARRARRASAPDASPSPAPAASAPGAGARRLNEATLEDLRALGLSLTQAKRVIAKRDAWGGFQSVGDLDRVPGLPRALLGDIKESLSGR